MSAIDSRNCKEPTVRSFWKKSVKSVPGSIRPVYGAQYPVGLEKSVSSSLQKSMSSSSGGHDTFEEFERQTNDAWDDGDDDLLLEAFNVRISRRDVQSTAVQVLENHSQQQVLASAARLTAGTTSPDKPDLSPNNSSPHHSNQSTTVSGPNTPAHVEATHRLGGPGLGVRLDACQFPTKSLHFSQMPLQDRERLKVDKLTQLFRASNVNLDELRKLCWSGIPSRCRPIAWKLLSGYISPIMDRREAMLERKRLEYHNFVEQYYSTRHQDIHRDTYRQIHIDIPRMCPLIPLFQQSVVQQIFERILYIWAIRHPASGYVQGINDLVTPFFVVFLSEYLPDDADIEHYQLEALSTSDIQNLEADCFWCFSKLLDGIQDNYTFAQPGIQTRVNTLKELISRIDNSLHRHLECLHIEYLQFAFRWMNNLLMREMPLHCVVRLWDTYLSEPDGFATFHLYVCASFLTRFSSDLQHERDFHGLMVLLQNLPTEQWTDEEVGLVLADAYRLKYMFADAPKHLKDNATP